MRNVLILLVFLFGVYSCSKKVKEVKYEKNGQLKERYEYYEADNGSFIKDGEYQAWYPNGMIMHTGEYEDNKKVGIWEKWTDSGYLSEKTTYEDDKRNGLYQKYWKDKIEFERTYVNDKRHGKGRVYWRNGQLSGESNYIEDLQDGHITWYDSLGNKETEEYYEMGKKTGTWEKYKGDSVLFTITFENEIPVEIIGNWVFENKRKTTVEIKKDGTLLLTYPKYKDGLMGYDPLQTAKYDFKADIDQIDLYRPNSDYFYDSWRIVNVEQDKLHLRSARNGLYLLKRVY
jgi:antitoxin component YwqK of YwqJK toxin-antitoxin module